MRRLILTAMVGGAFWLAGTPAALAQDWLMEPVPPDGARATIQTGDARIALSCVASDSGVETYFTYVPSDFAAVRLRRESIDGRGPDGDGETSGYLFLSFATTSVQQYVHRDSTTRQFTSDQVGDALIDLLRAGNEMQVMPHLFSEDPYDTFSLSGSARAIAAALDACVPELLLPPQPDGSLARVGGVDAFLDDVNCRRVMPLRVVAPAASVFSELPAVLDQLVAEVRRPVLELCPNAEQIRIAGFAGGQHVYDGAAARDADWVVIDLALPGEALVPHGPPPVEPARDEQTERESVADAPVPPEATVRDEQAETPVVADAPVPPEDTVGDDQAETQAASDAGLPPAAPADEEAPLTQDVAVTGAPAVASADEYQAAPPVAGVEQPATRAAAEAGPACPDPAAPGAYATPGAASNLQSGDYVFSDQDDVVLLAATARAAAGRSGNDLFYLFPESGLSVYGQAGADTFVLCSLDAPEVAIGLDYSGLTLHDAPDTVVIDAAVLGVQDGRRRDVNIFGFYPAIDRLILRVPEGVEIDLPADTSTQTLVIHVGEVAIGLRRADDPSTVPFDPDAIRVVEDAD